MYFYFVSILELIEILKGECWRLFSGFYTGCISFVTFNQQCVTTKGTMLDASPPFYITFYITLFHGNGISGI